MRDHTKLTAFALADELVLDIYAVTRRFPDDERYGLTAQMRRAAISVAANIVEASARPSEAEYLRLLCIAYGSAKELQYQITICVRLQYLDAEAADKVTFLASRTARALWGLVAAIRRSGLLSGRSP
jgi:four helix bundle protein